MDMMVQVKYFGTIGSDMKTDIFRKFEGIETERLFVRKLSVDDSYDIFDFTSDPDVSFFLSWEPHKSTAVTAAFIKSIENKYENDMVSQWGIELKAEKKVIGIGGFINYYPEHTKAEIAFVLSNKHWGHGFMPEALKGIIDFGFNQIELNRIEAKCEIDNFASEKTLQKIGMRLEGCKYDFLMRKDKLRSFKFYAILNPNN